jgi:hypothetical protein
MVQAWDYLDAGLLWQRWREGSELLIGDVFIGDHVDSRIANTCRAPWSPNGPRPAFAVTLADLADMCESEILREPNLGKVCLGRIKQVLGQHGLSLAAPPRWEVGQ